MERIGFGLVTIFSLLKDEELLAFSSRVEIIGSRSIVQYNESQIEDH
jgi:hypothetical protein